MVSNILILLSLLGYYRCNSSCTPNIIRLSSLWYHSRELDQVKNWALIRRQAIAKAKKTWYAVSAMKTDIHPTYFPKAKVTCACGQSFTIGSTVEHMNVEICSACHPFFTGKQKLMDSAGRVDRFRKRAEKSQTTTKRKLKEKAGSK